MRAPWPITPRSSPCTSSRSGRSRSSTGRTRSSTSCAVPHWAAARRAAPDAAPALGDEPNAEYDSGTEERSRDMTLTATKPRPIYLAGRWVDSPDMLVVDNPATPATPAGATYNATEAQYE